jgi:choline dehydrogenase-like flavoprotein
MRDVIVVGAGGGGPVVAKELAARGLDVLLLEAGARFADPEREWTHFEGDAGNPAGGFFRFGPADRAAPPWRRELPQNSALLQVAGVGGTTLHYVGNSPRAMPGVFRDYEGADHDAYDTAHLFPFPYQELVPYYEWVEATLPVQTAAMGTKEEIFFAAAAELGLPIQIGKDVTEAAYRPQENAILQPEGNAGTTGDPALLRFPLAGGCTFCGHCVQGCFLPRGAPRNLKAKRSTDNSYVPMALTADRWSGGKALTLLADAFAIRVDTDERGAARGVTWRVGASGELASEEAHVVVLATGAIETPRLWLNSGLPNPNDWVGRGLTDHAMDLVVGELPFDAGASRGPSSAARADFPGRGSFEQTGSTPALAARALTLSDAGIAGLYDNGRRDAAHGADSVGRLVGPELKAMLSDVDRLLGMIVLTDDDVEADNRVTLSATAPPDEHGPIARVEIGGRTRSARTLANREFLVGQAVQLAHAAGATKDYRLNWPPVLMHLHSTMRMGASEADSVLDEGGESRGVPRLFVADNSALANALGGPNPTLTTQALATRTAEAIFRRYFGGDPWVGHEAPVASTDMVVTEAVMHLGLT